MEIILFNSRQKADDLRQKIDEVNKNNNPMTGPFTTRLKDNCWLYVVETVFDIFQNPSEQFKIDYRYIIED
jgi:hypothetical protein